MIQPQLHAYSHSGMARRSVRTPGLTGHERSASSSQDISGMTGTQDMWQKVRAGSDAYSPLFAAHSIDDARNPTTAPAKKMSASIIRSDIPLAR